MHTVPRPPRFEIEPVRRRLSRRGFLRGTATVAGTGALAVTFGARYAAFAQESTPDDAMDMGNMDDAGGMGGMDMMGSPFADDIEVLNYALTLEHLEYAFYRDGVGLFSFGTDGFGQDANVNLAAIRDHEGAHVATLSEVITDLGGTPVAAGTYNFADAYASLDAFLATAAAVENLGVRAYDGAAKYLQNADLLTAAGSIVAVEARHASYLNLLTGANPFPVAFEAPLEPADVLEMAAPFIAG
jgi:rubrerythrin